MRTFRKGILASEQRGESQLSMEIIRRLGVRLDFVAHHQSAPGHPRLIMVQASRWATRVSQWKSPAATYGRATTFSRREMVSDDHEFAIRLHKKSKGIGLMTRQLWGLGDVVQ